MVAIGVMTLVFVHIYINIAMSIGLMPITGLPLPFISAGKTFLVTLLAALGIVQSISLHREEKI
jgi:rod shape determining protein RodA